MHDRGAIRQRENKGAAEIGTIIKEMLSFFFFTLKNI